MKIKQNTTKEKSWEEEFDKKFGVHIEGQWTNEELPAIKAFIKSEKQKSYKEGKQSVLDKWRQEKEKLLQGFRYKKEIEELITEYTKAWDEEDPTAKAWLLKELLSLFTQYQETKKGENKRIAFEHGYREGLKLRKAVDETLTLNPDSYQKWREEVNEK